MKELREETDFSFNSFLRAYKSKPGDLQKIIWGTSEPTVSQNERALTDPFLKMAEKRSIVHFGLGKL